MKPIIALILLLFLLIQSSVATDLTYQVAASADDGWWTSASFSNTASTQVVGYYPNYVYNAFSRWLVTIPAGATITSSHISFYSEGNVNAPASTTLYFEKAANPTACSDSSDANGRTKTTANVSWSATASAYGTQFNSPDISSIINELYSSYSYSSGSYMQMLWIGHNVDSTSHVVQIDFYDYSLAHSPTLYITYTLPNNSRGGTW